MFVLQTNTTASKSGDCCNKSPTICLLCLLTTITRSRVWATFAALLGVCHPSVAHVNWSVKNLDIQKSDNEFEAPGEQPDITRVKLENCPWCCPLCPCYWARLRWHESKPPGGHEGEVFWLVRSAPGRKPVTIIGNLSF